MKNNKKFVPLMIGAPILLATQAAMMLASVSCSKVNEDDRTFVTKTNTLLKIAGSFETMHEMMTYLLIQGVDLESAKPQASSSYEFVWDEEKNVIVELDGNGNVYCGPDGYQLSPKNKIWKLIDLPSTNADSIILANSDYGQYIKTAETTPTQTIQFGTSIDTGFNKDLDLCYSRSEALDVTPKIVTNEADLEINGTSTNIEHYGHAKSVTITNQGDNKAFNEHGTIDGNIVVTSGKVVAEPTAVINTIIVTTETVSVEVKKDSESEQAATVGSVAKTENVEVSVESLVTEDEGIPEEQKPKKEEEAVDPAKLARYEGGLGTIKSPYVISSPQQLKNCSVDVNDAQLSVSKTLNFILSKDIDMSDTYVTPFKPIGTVEKPFYGVFNGNGYTISNLWIDTTKPVENGDFGFMGLFGCTNGQINSDFNYASRTSIWDEENEELDKRVFDISKYSTIIKNLTLDNIVCSNPDVDAKELGGVVGRAQNTYFDSINVTSGQICAGKAVGGIAGSAVGCIFNACTTGVAEGNNLLVKATKRNAGGLVGSCSYETETCENSSEAFISCINYADVKQENQDNNYFGYAGGIAGLCQEDGIDHGYMVVQDCINYGDIYAQAGSASGISSAQRVWIYNRCYNNGKISNGITVKPSSETSEPDLGGIGTHGLAKCYDCHNTGDIEGGCSYMAGILANAVSGRLDNTGLANCTSVCTLTPKNEDTWVCSKAQIASGQTTLVLKGNVFENVAAVNEAISSKIGSAISVEFQDVTVNTLDDAALNIPSTMQSIVSNTQIAKELNVPANTKSLLVNVPNMNINVKEDCPNASIVSYGKNSTLTVESGKTCKGACVCGEDAKIYNYGTITGSMGVAGYATNGENAEGATCSSVSFGHPNTQAGHGSKTFINRGTIKTTAVDANEHVISCIGDAKGYSDCSIDFNNYGTIEYEASESVTIPGYLILLYNQGENVENKISCYAGSVIKTSYSTGYRFAISKSLQLRHQVSATSAPQFIVGTRSISNWNELATTNVTVVPFNN